MLSGAQKLPGEETLFIVCFTICDSTSSIEFRIYRFSLEHIFRVGFFLFICRVKMYENECEIKRKRSRYYYIANICIYIYIYIVHST